MNTETKDLIYRPKHSFFKIGQLQRDWRYPIVVVLVLLLAAALASPRTYGSNDNFGITENARVGFSTPYTAYSATYVLHLLYSQWPGVPWLEIELYVSLLSAAAATGFLVSTGQSNIFFKSAVLAILACCILPFMIRPDYNASSIILGGSAMYLFAFSKPCKRCTALVIVFYFWSFSIRKMGFYGSLFFSAPFALCSVLQASNKRTMQFAFISMVLCILFVADALFYKICATPAEREYIAFNDIRKYLHDSPFLDGFHPDQSVLLATRWSVNDYWLFDHWFYLDERRFNIRSLNALQQLVHSSKPSQRQVWESVNGLCHAYRGQLLLLLALLGVPFLSRGWEGAVWALAGLIAFFLSSLLLDIFWYFPDHVALPMVSVAVLGLIVMFSPSQRQLKLFEVLVLVLIVAFVSYLTATETLKIIQGNIEHNITFRKNLRQLNALPADSIVLFGGGVLEMDWSDPFQKWCLKPKHILTGMSIYSPLFYGALKQVGLKKAKDIVPFLATSGRGYLAAYSEAVPHLLQFALEAYGLKIHATEIAKLESGSQIYKLSLQKALE